MNKSLIKNIPCVILSGGKSSRMGEDKSLIPFQNGKSMIEYLHQKLSLVFKDIYISSKTDKFDTLDIKNKKLILDTDKIVFSPMVALQTIFNTLQTTKLFIITVDTPFIQKETILELIKQSDNFSVTIAKDSCNNTHNLCGVFSKDTLPFIEDMLKNDIHKINYLIKNSNHQIITFQNDTQFLNINTKESFTKAKSFLEVS